MAKSSSSSPSWRSVAMSVSHGDPRNTTPPVIQRDDLPSQHDVRTRDLDQEQERRAFPDGLDGNRRRDLRLAKAQDLVELRKSDQFRAKAEQGRPGLGDRTVRRTGEMEWKRDGELRRRQADSGL
jgi:hypothetical protein